MGCLYLITSPSGKSYIGITKRSLESRITEHCKSSQLIGRAIRKYGLANMIITELEQASDWAMLQALEIQTIAAVGSKYPKGYNLTDGGDGNNNQVFTYATRQKISAKVKGFVKSKEHIAKIVAKLKGRKLDDMNRKRAVEALKYGKSTLQYQEAFRTWVDSNACAVHLRNLAKTGSLASKTPDAIEKWRKSREGFQFSEESKLKISQSNSKPKPAGFNEKVKQALAARSPEAKAKQAAGIAAAWAKKRLLKEQNATRT